MAGHPAGARAESSPRWLLWSSSPARCARLCASSARISCSSRDTDSVLADSWPLTRESCSRNRPERFRSNRSYNMHFLSYCVHVGMLHTT